MARFTYGILLDYINQDNPMIELWPAIDSGFLRLSSEGLLNGEGTYTSPVVDLGEIYTLSGIAWDSEELYGTSIDAIAGGNKTFQLRFHDYYEPTLNIHGFPWSNQELPSSTDPMWGSSGSINWVDYQNYILTSGVMVRYVQWRTTLRGA